jgi:hypothetical protein
MRFSWPGPGRTRTTASTGMPRAAGSRSTRYPVITPAVSRRCTRSATEGADIATRRPSSAMLIRGLLSSSASTARFVSSSSMVMRAVYLRTRDR